MGVLVTVMVMVSVMCGVSAHHQHTLKKKNAEIQQLREHQIPVIKKYAGVEVKNLSNKVG